MLGSDNLHVRTVMHKLKFIEQIISENLKQYFEEWIKNTDIDIEFFLSF